MKNQFSGKTFEELTEEVQKLKTYQFLTIPTHDLLDELLLRAGKAPAYGNGESEGDLLTPNHYGPFSSLAEALDAGCSYDGVWAIGFDRFACASGQTAPAVAAVDQFIKSHPPSNAPLVHLLGRLTLIQVVSYLLDLYMDDIPKEHRGIGFHFSMTRTCVKSSVAVLRVEPFTGYSFIENGELKMNNPAKYPVTHFPLYVAPHGRLTTNPEEAGTPGRRDRPRIQFSYTPGKHRDPADAKWAVVVDVSMCPNPTHVRAVLRSQIENMYLTGLPIANREGAGDLAELIVSKFMDRYDVLEILKLPEVKTHLLNVSIFTDNESIFGFVPRP